MSDTSIGEVIEAGTMTFVAQCLEVPRLDEPCLFDPPPFGSFVRIGRPPSAVDLGEPLPVEEELDPFALPLTMPRQETRALSAAVYALVFGANTASLEPNRRPSALGFTDEDEMRREQPQIFELLRTEFQGLLIAYSAGDGKELRRHLPPKPPRIHSRVYLCDEAEVRMLTGNLSFLRSLLLPSGGSLSGVPSDELAAACLRQAREAHSNDQEFLRQAGKTLAVLLAEDYDRLQAILRNVI